MNKDEDMTNNGLEEQARRAALGLDSVRASLGDLSTVSPKELLAFSDFEAHVCGMIDTIAWITDGAENPFERALSEYQERLDS